MWYACTILTLVLAKAENYAADDASCADIGLSAAISGSGLMQTASPKLAANRQQAPKDAPFVSGANQDDLSLDVANGWGTVDASRKAKQKFPRVGVGAPRYLSLLRHRNRHGSVVPCSGGCATFVNRSLASAAISSLLTEQRSKTTQGPLHNSAGPTPGRLKEMRASLHVDLTATHSALARAEKLNIRPIGNETIQRKVGFLFMLMDGLDHEPIWDAFFENGGKDLFSIYTHQATPQGSLPLEKWGAIRVPQVRTEWCALAGVEVAVFAEALADPANVQFVLVSQNTVPLKPFPYVYLQLAEMSPTTSKICYASKPRKKSLHDEFVHKSCSFGDWYRAKNPRVWKHHQWVVLSRQHAFTFVRNAGHALHRYFQTSLGLGGMDGCSDEAVVSAALLLAEEEKKTKNQTMVKEEHAGDEELVASDDLARIGVQQACLTWTRWRNCFAGTPLSLQNNSIDGAKKTVELGRKTLEDFLETRKPNYRKLARQSRTSPNGFPQFFGPPAEDPTVKISYLRYLVVESGFMFGRKFNYGCLVSVSSNQSAQSSFPLQVVLPLLWQDVVTNIALSRVWSRLDARGMP